MKVEVAQSGKLELFLAIQINQNQDVKRYTRKVTTKLSKRTIAYRIATLQKLETRKFLGESKQLTMNNWLMRPFKEAY